MAQNALDRVAKKRNFTLTESLLTTAGRLYGTWMKRSEAIGPAVGKWFPVSVLHPPTIGIVNQLPTRGFSMSTRRCHDCEQPVEDHDGVLCFDPSRQESLVVHDHCQEPTEYFYDLTFSMLDEDGLNFWLDHLRRKLWWNPRLETALYDFAGTAP